MDQVYANLAQFGVGALSLPATQIKAVLASSIVSLMPIEKKGMMNWQGFLWLFGIYSLIEFLSAAKL